MNIFEQIVKNHGYLNKEIMNKLDKMDFGKFKDSFEVVIKSYDGYRIIVTLNEFNDYMTQINEDNIKEVFICSENLKIIKDMLDMKILDTEKLQCTYLAKQFDNYYYLYSERDLIEYLDENINVAKDLIDELNNLNGSFSDLRVFENDEDFFKMFNLKDFQLVCKVYYGNYRPYDEYVRFDVVDNLESLNEYQLKKEIKENLDVIVSETINNYDSITIYNKDFEYMLEKYMQCLRERGII